jgi:hypothetical protein
MLLDWRTITDDLGRRVAIDEVGDEFVFLAAGDPVPMGFCCVETECDFLAWLRSARARQVERARLQAERIAAEERALAERRRSGGLPPLRPAHPELVPELQAEYERFEERAR